MKTIKQILKTVVKYRISSTLTLISLIVAFLGIIVLTLYTSYEKSFDGFHKNDIYLMSFNIDMGSALPVPMAELVKSNVPEIEKSTVVHARKKKMFNRPQQTSKEAVEINTISASEEFFTMFDFPLISGDPEKVLSGPDKVVLSETSAKKIFGSTDIIGERVMVYNSPLTVSGIMQDMPENTSFRCDAVTSLVTRNNDEWREWSFSIFYQLKKGSDKNLTDRKIEGIEEIAGMIENLKKRTKREDIHIDLIALDRLHYGSRGYMFASVNKTVLDVLDLLIIVLAVMGAVNFINFSTSQAPLRAKSLSVRQILGEKKGRSRSYIIGEAVVLALFAMGTAFILHSMTYGYLENIFQIDGLSFKGREVYYAAFVIFAGLFGIVSALYPSYYITTPPVSQAGKGKMFFSGKGKTFRSMLIILQFVCTIALLASSLTIEKQLHFWNNFDIGIDKENVVYMRTSTLQKSHKAFANELMKNPEIINYCYTQFLPGSIGMGWGRNVDGQAIQLQAWPIDDRFIDFFGIKIKEGHKFGNGEADIDKFILNEKAVQEFGWKNPLERKISGFDFIGDIVGISQNFNFESLKNEIRPMLFWRTDTRKHIILIKFKTKNYTLLKNFIENTARKFDPETVFQLNFLDDTLEQLYNKEIRMAHFIEFVALWTIILALTGLFGLIIFISRDKVKEIGIRKVNGASTPEIVRMLNKNVAVWLGIAFVIATPITYHLMNRWLENFAYKTALSWWIFAVAGLTSFLVALLTVSWQSWMAASRNPVESIRYE